MKLVIFQTFFYIDTLLRCLDRHLVLDCISILGLIVSNNQPWGSSRHIARAQRVLHCNHNHCCIYYVLLDLFQDYSNCSDHFGMNFQYCSRNGLVYLVDSIWLSWLASLLLKSKQTRTSHIQFTANYTIFKHIDIVTYMNANKVKCSFKHFIKPKTEVQSRSILCTYYERVVYYA